MYFSVGKMFPLHPQLALARVWFNATVHRSLSLGSDTRKVLPLTLIRNLSLLLTEPTSSKKSDWLALNVIDRRFVRTASKFNLNAPFVQAFSFKDGRMKLLNKIWETVHLVVRFDKNAPLTIWGSNYTKPVLGVHAA